MVVQVPCGAVEGPCAEVEEGACGAAAAPSAEGAVASLDQVVWDQVKALFLLLGTVGSLGCSSEVVDISDCSLHLQRLSLWQLQLLTPDFLTASRIILALLWLFFVEAALAQTQAEEPELEVVGFSRDECL